MSNKIDINTFNRQFPADGLSVEMEGYCTSESLVFLPRDTGEFINRTYGPPNAIKHGQVIRAYRGRMANFTLLVDEGYTWGRLIYHFD